jgi:hypothetical protein
MSSDHTIAPHRGPGRRRRETKPERMVIGGKEFLRNDIYAGERGESERTIDRRGGPVLLVGGVKYRPPAENDAIILARMTYRNQPTPKRRRGRAA